MTNHTTIDVHAVLSERGQIAIIWGLDDVREVRPELTDEECWRVLEFCEHAHDASLGITWDTLASAVELLFDDPTHGSSNDGRPA